MSFDSATVKPDPVRSSSDRLVEEISFSILQGEFAPGERLTEAELAQRFGVNRAPLREALLRLQEQQLIERIPFSGMRVVQPTPRMLSELYEIRSVLEGLACRRAAAVITPAQIAELEGILTRRAEQVRMLARRHTPQPASAHTFHEKIAELSGNLELQRLLNKAIWHYLRGMYQRWNRLAEELAAGAREHLAVLDALRARDGELADMLMRRHIMRSRQAWEEGHGVVTEFDQDAQ